MIQKLTNTTRTLSLALVGLLVWCFASVRPSVAQDVAFYPDLRNETKIVEREGSIRGFEVATFGDGVLFLTETELVFANWDSVTLLKSGLSTPKHLFVKGDRYYFAEGSKLYRGIGFAPPSVVLTHTTQIDEIFYGDAQHKELVFISLDRPGSGGPEQELYIYNFQSGVATDQGIAPFSTGYVNFSGYAPRTQRRFVTAVNFSALNLPYLLVGFRDVASGVVPEIISRSSTSMQLFSVESENVAFVARDNNVELNSLDPEQPTGFSTVSINNPQKDVIRSIMLYNYSTWEVIKDPSHEGYLGFRLNDSGATILTRFTAAGYQDIADASSFVSVGTFLQMAKHRGHVFFFNPYVPEVMVRLLSDDSLQAIHNGDTHPLSKSFGNIRKSMLAPTRLSGVYSPYVEGGDFVYETTTMSVGSKFKLLITRRNLDQCPSSGIKYLPGVCGCGVADTDTDNDGSADCHDECDNDPSKYEAGSCGCGVPDIDMDGDQALDCRESCNSDRFKTSPGACGCNVPDTDANKNGTADCTDVDLTLGKPSIAKVQRKVRVTLPTQASISYRYTYKFLNRKGAVVKKATGQSNSGKQLSLSIPKGAATLVLSFVAKGRGYKDYRSPNYKQTL
jgi:hypothetical protein